MLFGWQGDSPLGKPFKCMALWFLQLICMLPFHCYNESNWYLTKNHWEIWIWAKCISKSFPLKVIEKLAVMLLLSELPLIVTALEFFLARVDWLTWTYFVGVRSMLMIKESGMLYLSTLDIISWVNSRCTSLKVQSGISTLAVVLLLQTKPIRQNKLCTQEDDSRSICPTYLGLQDINTLAVLVATDLEIMLPRLLDAMIYFWTIASILFPNRSGHPVGSLGYEVLG